MNTAANENATLAFDDENDESSMKVEPLENQESGEILETAHRVLIPLFVYRQRMARRLNSRRRN